MKITEYHAAEAIYKDRIAGYVSEKDAFTDGFLEGQLWRIHNPLWRQYPQNPPSDGQQVLCQYKDGSMQTNVYTHNTKKLFDRCVVAWLPRPKPYKPD